MLRRSSKWMALCTLEEWLQRTGIQRQKCDVGHNRSECLEKGRGSHVGQKHFDKPERESPENVWYTSMPVWSEDSGVDRTTTTTETARL